MWYWRAISSSDVEHRDDLSGGQSSYLHPALSAVGCLASLARSGESMADHSG